MNQQQTQTWPSDCEQIRELIPAYSMGITDPAETALVESLLPQCPQAQLELAEFRQLAGEMAQTVPQIAPPADLRGRILKAVETPAAPVPAAPVIEFKTDEKTPTTAKTARFNWTWAAAAVITILLALNATTLVQIGNLQSRQDSLEDELRGQVELLTHFATDDILEFTFYEPASDSPLGEKEYTSKGRVLCNPNSNIGVIRVVGLPPLGENQTYQVWLNREEERTSGGVFLVNEYGDGTFVFHSPLPMGSYDYIGISPEPNGGSKAPTAPSVARVQLY